MGFCLFLYHFFLYSSLPKSSCCIFVHFLLLNLYLVLKWLYNAQTSIEMKSHYLLVKKRRCLDGLISIHYQSCRHDYYVKKIKSLSIECPCSMKSQQNHLPFLTLYIDLVGVQTTIWEVFFSPIDQRFCFCEQEYF